MVDLLLDSCVMINLAGSGVSLGELARSNQVAFRMARVAAQEVLYVGSSGDDAALEEIDLADFVGRDEIGLVDFDDEERMAFIEFARYLDDGEAATLALAVSRGWPVATADRKAQRLAATLQPPVRLLTTSTLLRTWAELSDSPERVGEAVRNIERRASYTPRISLASRSTSSSASAATEIKGSAPLRSGLRCGASLPSSRRASWRTRPHCWPTHSASASSR